MPTCVLSNLNGVESHETRAPSHMDGCILCVNGVKDSIYGLNYCRGFLGILRMVCNRSINLGNSLLNLANKA